MPLQEYDAIRLKREIEGTLGDTDAIRSGTNRTPGKDEVAQYIVTEVIEEGRWPVQMTQLAEETGYSRQHCANVVTDYFVGEDADGTAEPAASSNDQSPMTASPSHPNSTTHSTAASEDANPDSETIYYDSGGSVQSVTIQVPGDVDKDSYVRGFLDAKKRD